MSGVAGHLYFAEDQLVPHAVVSDDAAAQLRFFPLGGEVQEPALQRGVRLPEDLRSQERRRCHNSEKREVREQVLVRV